MIFRSATPERMSHPEGHAERMDKLLDLRGPQNFLKLSVYLRLDRTCGSLGNCEAFRRAAQDQIHS